MKQRLTLQGRAALVTGASRGLGRAIALALGGAGADVVLACKERVDLAAAVAQEIQAMGRRALVAPGDLADRNELRMLAERARSFSPGLNILVCNAGITLNRLLLQTSETQWDHILRVNLSGAAHLSRLLLPSLQQSGGDILFVSSYAARRARPGLSAYAASKAGLIGLGKSLAAEWGPDRIRVNVILPGYMNTDMGRAGGEAALAAAREASLLHTLSDPDSVAAFVVHLLGQTTVTGQVFNLDSRLLP